MGILLILNLIILGYFASRKLIKYNNVIFALAVSFCIGALAGLTSMYIIDVAIAKAFDFYNTANIYNAILTLFSIWFILKNKAEIWELCKKIKLADGIFLGIVFIWSYASYWMDIGMSGGDIKAYAGWADQMYHLSYIRSIAVGANIPVTFPYFADVPISYHFMFNYFCGKVAQAGLGSVVSMTLLSALSMTALCGIVIEFSKRIFKSSWVGILALVLMLFNGSFAIFEWIKNLGHFPGIMDFVLNKKQVTIQLTAVFSFDMFISQRHFALSLAVEILFFLLVYDMFMRPKGEEGKISYKEMIIPFFLIAVTPYWNPSIYIVCGLMLAMVGLYFLFRADWQKVKVFLITGSVALVFVLIQTYFYKKAGTSMGDYPKLNFNVWASSFWGTIWFWIQAHGLKLLFFIFALFIIPRKDMKFALFALVPLLIANIMQFGLYGFDNNKIIWGGYIIICIYAGFGILWLCKKLIPTPPSSPSELPPPLRRGGTTLQIIIVVILLIPMTISGIGDYFARVVNQRQATFAFADSDTRKWIEANTPKDSIFLTAHELIYSDSGATQVTMAGRLLYSVRNCTWTSVDTREREDFTKAFYTGGLSLDEAKRQLQERHISFILVDGTILDRYGDAFVSANFEMIYQNEKQKTAIFKAY